jgi:hypothetical protein
LEIEEESQMTGVSQKWVWLKSLSVRWGLLYVSAVAIERTFPFSWLGDYLGVISGQRWVILRAMESFHIAGADETPVRVIGFVLNLAAASLVGTLWFLLDRRRTKEDLWYELLLVLTRYTLAFEMFGYGMGKVVPTQGDRPDPINWVRPLMEFSPGEFVFLFLGYSQTYEVFAGLAEVAGAVLLVFRRTSTLGALISAGALVNIAVMDYGFRFQGMEWIAGQLLAMALLLLAVDGSRLIRVFILNLPVGSVPLERKWRIQWMGRAAWGLKVAICGFTACFTLYWSAHSLQTILRSPRSDFSGVYRVDIREPRGAAKSDGGLTPQSWRVLAIRGDCRLMVVRTMEDTRLWFELKSPDGGFAQSGRVDPCAGTLLIEPIAEGPKTTLTKSTITLTPVSMDRFLLQGEVEGAVVSLYLNKLAVPRAR